MGLFFIHLLSETISKYEKYFTPIVTTIVLRLTCPDQEIQYFL